MIETMFKILLEVMFPIFVIIGVGFLAERKLNLDMNTLSKLNFYIFIPALLFIKMINATLPITFMLTTIIFCALHFAMMLCIGTLVFSIPRFRQNRSVLVLATTMYNAGNYGIPLIMLAFGDALIDVIAMIVMMQNLFMFSIGLWLMEREERSTKSMLKGLLKIPVIPAIFAGLLIRVSGIVIPDAARQPLDYLSDGIIPLALITLGAKLARTKIAGDWLTTGSVAMLRLIASPAISVLLVIAFQVDLAVAPVLVMGTATPVAVNVYIIAQTYKRGEEVASRLVFWTTIAPAAIIFRHQHPWHGLGASDPLDSARDDRAPPCNVRCHAVFHHPEGWKKARRKGEGWKDRIPSHEGQPYLGAPRFFRARNDVELWRARAFYRCIPRERVHVHLRRRAREGSVRVHRLVVHRPQDHQAQDRRLDRSRRDRNEHRHGDLLRVPVHLDLRHLPAHV